jgi:hypothetical protein
LGNAPTPRGAACLDGAPHRSPRPGRRAKRLRARFTPYDAGSRAGVGRLDIQWRPVSVAPLRATPTARTSARRAGGYRWDRADSPSRRPAESDESPGPRRPPQTARRLRGRGLRTARRRPPNSTGFAVRSSETDWEIIGRHVRGDCRHQPGRFAGTLWVLALGRRVSASASSPRLSMGNGVAATTLFTATGAQGDDSTEGQGHFLGSRGGTAARRAGLLAGGLSPKRAVRRSRSSRGCSARLRRVAGGDAVLGR